MARKTGRRKGSRNKGYFYRKTHKAWFAKQGTKFVPLTDAEGSRLRERDTPDKILKESHARFLLTQRKAANGSLVPLWDLCQHYLTHIERTKGAASTLETRADALFDLCTGYGRKWRKQKAKPIGTDRIHPGFGKLPAEHLKPHDVLTWLDKHPGWGKGSSRMNLQAIKRALNFGVESGLIEKNPLRGMKIPAAGARITCISPEQEQALLAVGSKSLAIAIQVLLRTGMRPQEFAVLSKRHIVDHGNKMEFKFKAEEVKTRKNRTVRVIDPLILKLVRQQLDRTTRGPLFGNQRGEPWIVKSLSRAFTRAKNRCQKQGIEFDGDCCLYSCRHTFAKRVLTGYWNGKPVSIEVLALLMGNTPAVCRANYLQWSDSYEKPLWDAVG